MVGGRRPLVRGTAGLGSQPVAGVVRAWRPTGLKQHWIECYMASNDPKFETKAADIIGLYLRPPQHAAISCVDEKTAIEALGRRGPEQLPLSPGRLANDRGQSTTRPRSPRSFRQLIAVATPTSPCLL